MSDMKDQRSHLSQNFADPFRLLHIYTYLMVDHNKNDILDD